MRFKLVNERGIYGNPKRWEVDFQKESKICSKCLKDLKIGDWCRIEIHTNTITEERKFTNRIFCLPCDSKFQHTHKDGYESAHIGANGRLALII